ncbi:hypothetical protein [Wolbachia endosymbiont of Nasonia giraulti]|uniref:hypothetical protein n=1 Tax=Wolbachia endosymbiont of Nasonia giraulti TaxID=180838 RepID=UPI003A8B0DD2
MHQEHKKRNQEEVLDSEALSNLFKEEGNQPKLHAVAKETGDQPKLKDRTTQIVKFSSIATYASVIVAALASKLFPTPVCTLDPASGLSEQQAHLGQADGNSTVNLPSAHHVPTPQTMLKSKVDESHEMLNSSFKSAKNNFGASQSFLPK